MLWISVLKMKLHLHICSSFTVCFFLASFNFLSCYWPKHVIEMLLLWHDEFKRNNNLEKNAKMKFYMYLIAGHFMIMMSVGICNTTGGGGAVILQHGVKLGFENLSAVCDSYFDKDMLL